MSKTFSQSSLLLPHQKSKTAVSVASQLFEQESYELMAQLLNIIPTDINLVLNGIPCNFQL